LWAGRYFENLHTDAYHYLLKHGIYPVGNSFSGIIEASNLGVYTVNIGSCQKGRVRGIYSFVLNNKNA
jgi:UDP-N-acetylglucosamine 2-epimerase (non-hydrolysing)